MATAPGANMLSTNFWFIILLPVGIKTYRSLKIKFFVKVNNKVHVTIGHVCDFARNWVLHQNDFKVSAVLWNFVLINLHVWWTAYLQKKIMYFVLNSVVGIPSDAIFCLVTFLSFWCNVWVTFVTMFISIMCSLMHGQEKLYNFCFGNTSQVTSNKLMTSKPTYVVQ